MIKRIFFLGMMGCIGTVCPMTKTISAQLLEQVVNGIATGRVNAGTVCFACQSGYVKVVRYFLDQMKDKFERVVIVISGSCDEGRVQLVAGVTKNCTDKIHSGDLVSHVAEQIGGKGGGLQDMAQGGGQSSDNLPQALASV